MNEISSNNEKLKLIEEKWQKIVDLISEILDVKYALITKVDDPYISIIKSNSSDNNPFEEGNKYELTGYYCEKVIKNKKSLEVNNSQKDDNWENSPETEFGLISYLGFPIFKPDNDVFGTLCVLDNKEREFNNIGKEVMLELKKQIEFQLENIYLNKTLSNKIKEIDKIKNNYEHIINNINDALFLHKFSNFSEKKIGKFIKVNKKAKEKLGYLEEELLAMTPDDIDSSEFNESQQKNEIIKKLGQDGELTFEAIHKTEQGDNIPVEVNSKLIEYDEEQVVLSIARDITDRKAKRNELIKEKKKFEKILETTDDGFFIVDKDGHFLEVNNAFSQMIGYSKEELLNMKVIDIDIEENNKQYNQHAKRVINTDGDFFESSYKKKSGEIIDVEINTKFIDELTPPIFYSFIRDITERKEKENKIKYLSLHDQLTGLYNRRYFEDTVARLNESRILPIGIITADIDNLKSVNDLFGHYIGDRYLKEVANILKNNVRTEDIVCRIGGDEFAIILPEINKKKISKIEKRIQTKINDLDIKDINFSISTGYEIKTSEEQELREVVKVSDQRMYQMKKLSKEKNLKRKLSIVKNKKKIVFEEFPMPIIISDFEGHIVEVNNKLCQMLGYSEKELKNMTHFDITGEKYNEKNRELMQKVKNKELDGFELNKEYIKKNGEYIGLNIKVKVIKDYSGEPVFVFAFVETN